jgi:hypothetical protein
MGLVHACELSQQADCWSVGERVRGLRVIDVRADEVRLKHPIDRDQPIDDRVEIPDVLAEASEIIRRRLVTIASRPQLVQPLAQQVRTLRMVEHVVAKGRFERELRRGVRPPTQHLHELYFQVAIVGQALSVLLNRKAATKLTAIDDGHLLILVC